MEVAPLRVTLAGATGLVGGIVLDRLCARGNVGSVTTVSRNPVSSRGQNHTAVEADPDQWPGEVSARPCDVAICCLGTTLRAAGSKEAFAAVDHDAVVAFARAAQTAGARQFLLVTSVGADAGAANFYLATKGRAESAIRALGFGRLDIFRPGLLVGRRSGPLRLAERLAIAISPVTDSLTPAVLSRYRSIPAETVARAIVRTTGAEAAGSFVHHNDEMLTG